MEWTVEQLRALHAEAGKRLERGAARVGRKGGKPRPDKMRRVLEHLQARTAAHLERLVPVVKATDEVAHPQQSRVSGPKREKR